MGKLPLAKTRFTRIYTASRSIEVLKIFISMFCGLLVKQYKAANLHNVKEVMRIVCCKR
jgi:hypothetical protein